MEDHQVLERRVSQLERTLEAHSGSLARMQGIMERNTEILDDIRTYINRPTNWAEWVMAIVASAGAVGTVIWALWVDPLEYRLTVVEKQLDKYDEVSYPRRTDQP